MKRNGKKLGSGVNFVWSEQNVQDGRQGALVHTINSNVGISWEAKQHMTNVRHSATILTAAQPPKANAVMYQLTPMARLKIHSLHIHF